MPEICTRFHLPSSLSNQFPTFFSYFLSGMIFALFGKNLFSKLNVIFVPCVAVFIILNIFKVPFLTSFFSPVFLCVIVMFLGLNLKIFSNVNRKPDYSYGLYLVHYPLVMIFTQLEVFSSHQVFGIFAVLGTSFLCAYLMERISVNRKQFSDNRKQKKDYRVKPDNDKTFKSDNDSNLCLSAESAGNSFLHNGGAR